MQLPFLELYSFTSGGTWLLWISFKTRNVFLMIMWTEVFVETFFFLGKKGLIHSQLHAADWWHVIVCISLSYAGRSIRHGEKGRAGGILHWPAESSCFNASLQLQGEGGGRWEVRRRLFQWELDRDDWRDFETGNFHRMFVKTAALTGKRPKGWAGTTLH